MEQRFCLLMRSLTAPPRLKLPRLKVCAKHVKFTDLMYVFAILHHIEQQRNFPLWLR